MGRKAFQVIGQNGRNVNLADTCFCFRSCFYVGIVSIKSQSLMNIYFVVFQVNIRPLQAEAFKCKNPLCFKLLEKHKGM